jgi:hypothetical protein
MVTDQVKIRPGLQALSCTVSAAAGLCVPPMVRQKLSQQELNKIVNGYVDADADQVRQILSVLHTMEYLQETIVPKLPIRWDEPLLVRDILIRTYQERLNAGDPIETRCWYVRLSIFNFLKSINSNGPVETINLTDACAFSDRVLAQKAADKLKTTMKIDANVELLTQPRRRSTLTTSLEDVGFQPEPAAVEVEA